MTGHLMTSGMINTYECSRPDRLGFRLMLPVDEDGFVTLIEPGITLLNDLVSVLKRLKEEGCLNPSTLTVKLGDGSLDIAVDNVGPRWSHQDTDAVLDILSGLLTGQNNS